MFIETLGSLFVLALIIGIFLPSTDIFPFTAMSGAFFGCVLVIYYLFKRSEREKGELRGKKLVSAILLGVGGILFLGSILCSYLGIFPERLNIVFWIGLGLFLLSFALE